MPQNLESGLSYLDGILEIMKENPRLYAKLAKL